MPERLKFLAEHHVEVGFGLLILGFLGIFAAVQTQNTGLFLLSLAPLTGGIWLVSS